VRVLQPLGRVAEALQLAFDPVDSGAVAIGPLAPVAERGQAPDRGLVPLQIETSDQHPHRVVGRSLGERGRAGHCDQTAEGSDEYVRAHELPFYGLGAQTSLTRSKMMRQAPLAA